MSDFQIIYPGELLAVAHQPPERLERLAREALLVRLYDIPDDLIVLLDAGEAATIALTHQIQPRLVLLDERRGRRVARERGLARRA